MVQRFGCWPWAANFSVSTGTNAACCPPSFTFCQQPQQLDFISCSLSNGGSYPAHLCSLSQPVHVWSEPNRTTLNTTTPPLSDTPLMLLFLSAGHYRGDGCTNIISLPLASLRYSSSGPRFFFLSPRLFSIHSVSCFTTQRVCATFFTTK